MNQYVIDFFKRCGYGFNPETETFKRSEYVFVLKPMKKFP